MRRFGQVGGRNVTLRDQSQTHHTHARTHARTHALALASPISFVPQVPPSGALVPSPRSAHPALTPRASLPLSVSSTTRATARTTRSTASTTASAPKALLRWPCRSETTRTCPRPSHRRPLFLRFALRRNAQPSFPWVIPWNTHTGRFAHCQGAPAARPRVLPGVFFPACRKVKTLSLRGNKIGARGGKEVAAMLNENPYIAVVDVAENSLQSSGITAFALLFAGPHSRLEDLDLGRNNFLDMDSEMFAKSLHQDQSLLKLTYVAREPCHPQRDRSIAVRVLSVCAGRLIGPLFPAFLWGGWGGGGYACAPLQIARQPLRRPECRTVWRDA